MRDILIRELNKDSDYISIKEISSQAWEPIYLHRKNLMDKDIFHSLYKDGHNNKANSLEKWCRENKDNVRLAENNGEVIGFITWEEFNNETIELSNNAVSPSFHGKGVGSQLYQWFFEFAKKQGFKYCFVFTGNDPAHIPARKAYEKNGFSNPVENVRFFKKL